MKNGTISGKSRWLLQAADLLARGLDGRKGRFLGLRERQVIDSAMRRTGLSDFGDDYLWEPLEILCRFTREGELLTALGRLAAAENIRRRLENRLKMTALFQSQPDILEGDIRKPVFIIGLPRTGTTLLQRLLACDPASRVLYNWEMAEPAPPPSPESFPGDARVRRDRMRWRLAHYASPGFRAIHESGAGVPDECVALMANDLNSIWFNIGVDCPEYREWVHDHCDEDIYRRHRRQLLLLQWKYPPCRWTLKTPYHLYGLEPLLKVYPDACVIHTHRDPLAAAPSIASLFSTMREVMHVRVDRKAVALECMEMLGRWFERGLAARRREEGRPGSRACFTDLDFRDFMRDPLGEVRRIYGVFGFEFDETVRGNMEAYMRENPRYKHGRHVYTLEEYGLTCEMVNRRFREYREEYAAVAPSLREKGAG